jgi:hypothetical protein
MARRWSPQQRKSLAQELRKRADTDPRLSTEQREKLHRTAADLVKLNAVEAKQPRPKPAISRDELRRIFDEASVLPADPVRDELAYRHMIAFADVLEGWALDERFAPEQTAMFLGMAESMRALADLVGPDWDPPKPERLSLIGFLGRSILDE